MDEGVAAAEVALPPVLPAKKIPTSTSAPAHARQPIHSGHHEARIPQHARFSNIQLHLNIDSKLEKAENEKRMETPARLAVGPEVAMPPPLQAAGCDDSGTKHWYCRSDAHDNAVRNMLFGLNGKAAACSTGCLEFKLWHGRWWEVMEASIRNRRPGRCVHAVSERVVLPRFTLSP